MSVVHKNGEWTHIPGHDVYIEQLDDNTKAWLWKGINILDPGRAKAMIAQKSDPDWIRMHEVFGTEMIMTEPEFYQYIEAAKAAEQQQEKCSA